ncbi:NAD(P)-dependent oxidoreductase [Acanthopleuribacter pedis]|uniref:NAD(P)-dependent oxidoreductase n=1 Tax=Acanthopleuribacter pedis TaxID=442870 RepID=A0A8J7QHK0_9BACT|nr:NAD(P)-dependent oxidoreductase [Acanthopleuribacter pedis]MBO1320636.1 NAD(P)-dependent oxidoreductase [Acanthopleuribacter pedis]
MSFKEPTIAWIGTGVMGAPMCGHLADSVGAVRVFNRTKSKAQPLLDQGAVWCESPAEAAAGADLVFTIVGFPTDVRAVYFGKQGILTTLKQGAVCVDFTTTSPSLAMEIDEAAKQRGAAAVDAPVSGGDVGARKAQLSIMVGGDAAAVDRVHPLLQKLGKNIVHQGPAGAGQHTKMCNQIVIAGTMIGVCESLLYATKAGLDLETMLSSISKGAAGCWTLDNLAPRIVKRNFEPGFAIDHFIKDMGIALAEAARMRLALPGLSLVHQLYVAAAAQGEGSSGTQALMRALERLAGQTADA